MIKGDTINSLFLKKNRLCLNCKIKEDNIYFLYLKKKKHILHQNQTLFYHGLLDLVFLQIKDLIELQ